MSQNVRYTETSGEGVAETTPTPNPINPEEVDVALSKRTTTPAFQFYPKEFLSSSKVIAMTAAERGVYITLLSMQWLDGSLPDDLPALARLNGLNPKAFARMWPHNLARCFVLKNGRLLNPKLEDVRRDQIAYRKRQAEHGAKGGRPKALTYEKGSAFPGLSQTEPRKSPSSAPSSAPASSSSSARRTQEASAPPLDVWLRELQAAYPQQSVTSGHLTETAFCDAMLGAGGSGLLDPAARWALMQANLDNQKAGHQWRVKRMIPKLQNWLREGLWQQQHEAHPPSTLVSDKTVRTLTSAEQFVRGGQG